ncbi:FG-GAP-like repeat-containing protein [Streptomyces sp. NPDC056361]|uniref:FG-GAP-like repeat-containing protein n=1 Tax=Streptomyces sp. NPDC056361 TaxID=3345795 RepID=UPI0035D8E29B
MSRTRTTKRRLALAVTAALVATAAPLVVAPAALATTATAATTQQDALTVPVGTVVLSSGPTGFLTRHSEASTSVYTWTRREDGVRTRLPGQFYAGSPGTDIVVRTDGGAFTYVDMATGAELVSYDESALGVTAYRHEFAGTTLVVSEGGANRRAIHLFSKDDQGRLVDRRPTGIPEDASFGHFSAGSPGTLVVQYDTRVDGTYRSRMAVVDVASATAVETFDALQVRAVTVSAVSATHVAWIEGLGATGPDTLAVARRGGTDVERVPLESTSATYVRLLGDWVLYGATNGATATRPDPLHQVTARSLKTGETVKVLDQVSTVTQADDGTLIVTGGALGQDRGLYRITLDETGTPTASLLATTGVPTALTLTDEIVPPAVDFDRNHGIQPLTWTFNRSQVDFALTLTHTASGKQRTRFTPPPPGTDFTVGWDGTFDDGTGVPSGTYTWKMTAEPANGIGPAVERSGTFTVTRTPKPHDFDDNGSPDLLARDGAGQLLAYDTSQALADATPTPLKPTILGTGWNIYDRVLAPGNLGGTPHADALARERNGNLWLYPGSGKALAPRIKVGTGWQTYDLITGGSDLTNDGRPDVVATDRTGGLWLYPGTGNANTPLGARKKIGTGWGTYNQITATGNIAGAPAGDLVARDTSGVLWLYLGKGDGTFAPRTRIGAGWNAYSHIVAPGDTDHDGRNDLVGYGDADGQLYSYKGTGDWRRPFTGRTHHFNSTLGRQPVTLF